MYRLIKPKVLNKPAHPHVKGEAIKKDVTSGPKSGKIEDADFEEIEE